MVLLIDGDSQYQWIDLRENPQDTHQRFFKEIWGGVPVSVPLNQPIDNIDKHMKSYGCDTKKKTM